jgi:hypothetical protein
MIKKKKRTEEKVWEKGKREHRSKRGMDRGLSISEQWNREV